MTYRRALVAAWASLLMCALVACGGNSPSPGASPSSGAGPTINVTIANGQISPTNVRLQAKVKQQITLHVSSDATDELHVHSVPDHKFAVIAAPNQTFEFSVDVPGSVDVESHHLHKTIATIQIQP